VANVGIKDDTLDFVVIASQQPCAAAGVFTRNRFAGSPVLLSRRHLADGRAQAVVAISKNANVATGAAGARDTETVAAEVAGVLGIEPQDVVVACTGVIGRRLPMDRILGHLRTLHGGFGPADFPAASRAIMTTDTVPKMAAETVGAGCVVGIAKGVGMIEPDMATLLAFFFTDVAMEHGALDRVLRRVVDRTFNCLSIDTDTSTSDSAIVLANGLAGPVPEAEFEEALGRVALALVKMVARDGEGATKVIEVTVDRARSVAQARKVAKLVVNSPLVKTAVHGADPNWGRVAMAVGKAQDEPDIDPEHTTIRFGDIEVYPRAVGDEDLAAVSELLQAEEVRIHVSLGTGDAAATVWGCDLSEGYVRINADYTT